MVIFDTNVLIELYRGNLIVKEETERIKSNVFYISSITAAEFMVVRLTPTTIPSKFS